MGREYDSADGGEGRLPGGRIQIGDFLLPGESIA
jgi:hypothetical protein